MTGGGFGGSAIALVRRDTRERVESAVVEAFRARGWRSPAFIVATAAGGAQQVVT